MAKEEKQSPNSLGLHAVKEKLSNIPHEEKSALVHVQRIRPELVDDKHILQFLSVENFNVDVSKVLLHFCVWGGVLAVGCLIVRVFDGPMVDIAGLGRFANFGY